MRLPILNAARRAKYKSERAFAEAIGRAYLKEQQQHREQAVLATVAGMLVFFTRERRNDMSAQAMADSLAMPDDYPVEAIAKALDQLRATGDYDRIVAETTGE